jgi:hypothetical protein
MDTLKQTPGMLKMKEISKQLWNSTPELRQDIRKNTLLFDVTKTLKENNNLDAIKEEAIPISQLKVMDTKKLQKNLIQLMNDLKNEREKISELKLELVLKSQRFIKREKE